MKMETLSRDTQYLKVFKQEETFHFFHGQISKEATIMYILLE